MAITEVATGRFVDVNAAFEGLLGRSRGDLIGRTSVELNLYPMEDRARIVEALRARGRVRNVPVALQTAHGTRRVIVGVDTIDGDPGSPPDAARPPSRMLTTFEDVTRLHAAQTGGEDATTITETAFEKAPIGKALVSLDGTFLRVNQTLCRIFGRGEAEILSSTFQEITHPDDLDADLGLLRETLNGLREGYSLEKRYLRPDGQVVRAQLDVSLVRTDDGSPAYFVSQIQDISALRRATDALAEREATLQRIYQSSPVLMGVVDLLDDDIVHISDNPATARFFGARVEDLAGKRSHADLGTPRDMLAIWLDAYREAVRTQAPVRFSYVHSHPARPGHLDVTVAPVGVSPEGHPRLSYVAVDLTREREREADLVAAREAALAADRAKSQFLAVMSHEIRTPLNSVLGFGELLSGTPLDAEQAEMVSLIRESGTSLLRLISDILDLSKIEAGGVEMESRPVNIARLIEAAIDTLRPRAAEKGLDIQLIVDPLLPPLVLGDELRLRQIFANYLTNAVKFTDRGGIVVRVRADRDLLDPQRYVVHALVRDSGIGVPSDRMDRLFRTFSQVDASTTRKYGGTGLGLVIVKRLAQLMDGDAWAESTEGDGSTFHVTFRLAEVAPLWRPKADEIYTPVFERGESLRVLVADDIASNRLMLRTLLRRLGLTTDDVEDGVQAAAAVRTAFASARPYDVVFMDVQMPNMDGLQATQAIRSSIPVAHQPRIIALTADALAGDREKCLRAGMDDYISKPFEANRLVSLLWHHTSHLRDGS